MKDLKGKIGFAQVEDAKVQTGEDGAGTLEGYLAVYGNVDSSDERIMKKAFSKSIRERVNAKNKVPLMAKHFAYGGDIGDMVGVITEAKEDDHGLFIKAEYLNEPDAQRMRGKIAAARAMGLGIGLSVGYRVTRYEPVLEDGKTIYNLKELELREGTITLKPCNDQAGVTNSKTEPDRSALEEQLSATLGVAKSTISAALDAAISAESTEKAKAEAAPTQMNEIAGLTAMEAEVMRNRINLIEMENN